MTHKLIKHSIVFVLFAVALLGLMAEPFDDSQTWFLDFFVSKGIGFGAGYYGFKLMDRWFPTSEEEIS